MCVKFCGLTDAEAVCFNHQIKKCNGICANEETAAVYNKRALEIIKKHSYKHPDFAIITEGRTSDEKSLMLIINNKYFGTGYFDDVTTVIQGGKSSVTALTGSTEEEQFH